MIAVVVVAGARIGFTVAGVVVAIALAFALIGRRMEQSR